MPNPAPMPSRGPWDYRQSSYDPSLFGEPQIAIYTVDKQPFHHIPEGMPAFEQLPRR